MKIPANNKIKILSSDEIKPVKLNWVVHEYIGCEIFKLNEINKPLTHIDDISPGDIILAPGFYGYYEMIVNEDKTSATTFNKQLSSILEFDTDDRHCWISSGLVNLKALKKLRLSNV